MRKDFLIKQYRRGTVCCGTGRLRFGTGTPNLDWHLTRIWRICNQITRLLKLSLTNTDPLPDKEVWCWLYGSPLWDLSPTWSSQSGNLAWGGRGASARSQARPTPATQIWCLEMVLVAPCEGGFGSPAYEVNPELSSPVQDQVHYLEGYDSVPETTTKKLCNWRKYGPVIINPLPELSNVDKLTLWLLQTVNMWLARWWKLIIRNCLNRKMKPKIFMRILLKRNMNISVNGLLCKCKWPTSLNDGQCISKIHPFLFLTKFVLYS